MGQKTVWRHEIGEAASVGMAFSVQVKFLGPPPKKFKNWALFILFLLPSPTHFSSFLADSGDALLSSALGGVPLLEFQL